TCESVSSPGRCFHDKPRCGHVSHFVPGGLTGREGSERGEVDARQLSSPELPNLLRCSMIRTSTRLLSVAAVAVMPFAVVAAQEIRDSKALEAEHAKVVRLYEQGKSSEALPIARRVVAAAEQLLGAEAVETGTYLNWLAVLYKDLGQYGQAEPHYRRSLV